MSFVTVRPFIEDDERERCNGVRLIWEIWKGDCVSSHNLQEIKVFWTHSHDDIMRIKGGNSPLLVGLGYIKMWTI